MKISKSIHLLLIVLVISCGVDEQSHTVPHSTECDGKDLQYCCDKDGDGYGVGFTRACIFSKEDFNDNCITCNPGAQERCDGYDNDGDGDKNEQVACENDFDCPQSTYGLNAKWNCENFVCFLYDCNADESCQKNKYSCINDELRLEQ